MGKVADAIEVLRTRAATMSGDELEKLLRDLQFDVRPTSSGKHQVVTHDGLEWFISTSFDKGHKKQMLPKYPQLIRKVLIQYQVQLETILGERHA